MEKGHRALEEEGVKNISLRLSREKMFLHNLMNTFVSALWVRRAAALTWEASKVSSHSRNFPVFLLASFGFLPPSPAPTSRERAGNELQ